MAIGGGLTGAPRGLAGALVAFLAAEAVYRVALRSHVRRSIGMTLHDYPVVPLIPGHIRPSGLPAHHDGATP
jgi:hypothetical protein